jgi:predicted ATPase
MSKWVKRFEFGDRLELHNMSEDLFCLTFNTKSKHMNIADSGFGASQVLPLVVQALAAPRNSMTLAEQPEIHLNPRLQVVLADLFAEMANGDHRLVVETHSEHLLLRVRRLVASGVISPAKVAIYFVERRGDESHIREIRVREDGHIDPRLWPAGFFEDALRESLGLATEQATKQLQKRPDKNAA